MSQNIQQNIMRLYPVCAIKCTAVIQTSKLLNIGKCLTWIQLFIRIPRHETLLLNRQLIQSLGMLTMCFSVTNLYMARGKDLYFYDQNIGHYKDSDQEAEFESSW